MKLYTYYTPSHKVFYDQYFYPSLQKYFLNDKNSLIVKTGDQITSTGGFNDTGFNLTTLDKVKLWLSAIKENPNDFWIYADPDICFYDNFEQDLLEKIQNYNLVAQSDNTRWFEVCTGFFIARSSDLLYKFFLSIINEMQTTNIHNDQLAFAKVSRLYPNLKFNTLPIQYWSVHWSNGGKVWSGEDIDPPKNMKIHHANYTVGIENKLKLLNMIKGKFNVN